MLTNVFGLSIKYAAWSHQDDLPLYIAEVMIFIQHILEINVAYYLFQQKRLQLFHH